MKKKVFLLMSVMAVLTLTACGKDKNEGEENTSVTVSGDEMAKVTEGAIETAESTEAAEETTEQTEEQSNKQTSPDKSAYESRTGYDRFIPAPKGEIPTVSQDLETFYIDGKEYNLVNNTISDIIEGNRMFASTQYGSITDNKDYYFKGGVFRQDNREGIMEVYVEEMLDGEPVLGYDKSKGDEYELFGVRIDALADPNVTDEQLTFASGIKLYMTKDEIEAILGEGCVGDEGAPNYPTYYYKSDTVTLCIVYTHYHDNESKPLRARQITIVKNV